MVKDFATPSREVLMAADDLEPQTLEMESRHSMLEQKEHPRLLQGTEAELVARANRQPLFGWSRYTDYNHIQKLTTPILYTFPRVSIDASHHLTVYHHSLPSPQRRIWQSICHRHTCLLAILGDPYLGYLSPGFLDSRLHFRIIVDCQSRESISVEDRRLKRTLVFES